MAGYFHLGTCYALQNEAIDAYFQSIPPTILTTTTTQSVHQFQKQVSGSWNSRHFTQNATGVVTQQYSVAVANPNFSACEVPNDNTTNFLNGMELGWAVATVCVIVFAIRRSYRGF